MSTSATIEPQLEIRRAEEDDLSALLALYHHLNRDDATASRTRYSEVWSQIMLDDRLRILVGKVGGEPISTCTLLLVPNLTRAARAYGLIENVVTNPDHRGKGYGTAVLREALRQAWEFGCYKVMLLAGSKREATLRFYENAGFQRGVKTGFVAHPPKGARPPRGA